MKLARASVAATVVLVVAVGILLQRHALFGDNPVAILIQVLAALLMLWARLTLGWRSFHAAANPTSGGIITTGPYRFFRHPIYAAIVYFVWAGVFSQASILTGVLGRSRNGHVGRTHGHGGAAARDTLSRVRCVRSEDEARRSLCRLKPRSLACGLRVR